MLAEKGKPLGRKLLGEMASLATPQTILRWYREQVAAKYDGSRTRGRPGRPAARADGVQQLLTMARENPPWGYTRLRGALENLGFELGRSTIQRRLRAIATLLSATFSESVRCTCAASRSAAAANAARECSTASLGVLREPFGVSPEERVVVLERHDDAPEGVVVRGAQRIAQAIETCALLLRGLPSDDLRERLLDAHSCAFGAGSAPAHATTSASALRTSPRQRPSSARFPMGSVLAAALRDRRFT